MHANFGLGVQSRSTPETLNPQTPESLRNVQSSSRTDTQKALPEAAELSRKRDTIPDGSPLVELPQCLSKALALQRTKDHLGKSEPGGMRRTLSSLQGRVLAC